MWTLWFSPRTMVTKYNMFKLQTCSNSLYRAGNYYLFHCVTYKCNAPVNVLPTTHWIIKTYMQFSVSSKSKRSSEVAKDCLCSSPVVLCHSADYTNCIITAGRVSLRIVSILLRIGVWFVCSGADVWSQGLGWILSTWQGS